MSGGWKRLVAALGSLTLAASCTGVIPAAKAPPRELTDAVSAGVRKGPSIGTLNFAADDAAAAIASFVESCPRLLARTDISGLTRIADWKPSCQAAASWPAADAPAFFRQYFETARIGEGKAHATGYYEPEIAGVRRRQAGFDVPVYGLPSDLVRAQPGESPPLANGRQPSGRYDETGRFVPYYDRAAIEDGALAGRGLEIAWAADPIELFFVEIQGSGRLRAPDGSVMRIGYAGQNGLPYTAIGALLRQRDIVGSGPGQISGSMQSLIGWIRAHPAEGRALMRENRSYIFFTELKGDGPLGALNVPVRALSSVAADPRFVPLGAPVILSLDRPEANGLWVAQDTGGAIKGANRFDTFWGAGAEARRIAGGMSDRGSALLLLPKGTVERLGGK